MTVRAPAVSESPRVPEIRGRAHRTYRVRDIPEVDEGLHRLRTWLARRLADARVIDQPVPLFLMQRYWHDVDLLLDVRSKLMSKRQR